MAHPSYERRKLEVFFAVLTSGFGLWLLFPAEAMGSPALRHLIWMARETAWGGMFLSMGLAHCVWLAVNGARWWSPLLRFWAAFGSGCLYFVWASAIIAYDPVSTGVFTYGALSGGSWACCVFAWRDAVSSVRIYRAFTHHS